MNMPIKVAESDQAPALGAAIYAAVASGIYASVSEASAHMGSNYEAEYTPDPVAVMEFEKSIHSYERLGAYMENVIKNK